MGMARSKGVIISVKVPINWSVMTKRTHQRLRQIVGRDTRAIRAFLGIIEQHENVLLTGRNKNRISDGELHKLTMTAIKVKTGCSQRLAVPHDMKARFPRISTNELQECRRNGVSYGQILRLGLDKQQKCECVIQLVGPRNQHSRRAGAYRFPAPGILQTRLDFSRSAQGRYGSADTNRDSSSQPENRSYNLHLGSKCIYESLGPGIETVQSILEMGASGRVCLPPRQGRYHRQRR